MIAKQKKKCEFIPYAQGKKELNATIKKNQEVHKILEKEKKRKKS